MSVADRRSRVIEPPSAVGADIVAVPPDAGRAGRPEPADEQRRPRRPAAGRRLRVVGRRRWRRRGRRRRAGVRRGGRQGPARQDQLQRRLRLRHAGPPAANRQGRIKHLVGPTHFTMPGPQSLC